MTQKAGGHLAEDIVSALFGFDGLRVPRASRTAR
jgi:hypothetical protein